ncbi:hypothetical protein BLAC_00205 [Bifidobacterium animalis subsp. lactis ATCC 27673]|nr:hypothetical protein BLAC_00205 [Bifidobacterium animalis subsp. lactis ATCC 27673]KOA48108.1 hypothetical protein BAAA27673_00495 [Bifidobacterium animalis subsp. lactis ATCC 27673]
MEHRVEQSQQSGDNHGDAEREDESVGVAQIFLILGRGIGGGLAEGRPRQDCDDNADDEHAL